MDDSFNLVERLGDSSSELWNTVSGFMPELFATLVLLIVGLVVAKLAQVLLVKILEMVGVRKLAENKQVAKTLRDAEIKVDVVDILGRILFWVVIVIFALAITDVLGLTAMRDVIDELLGYLPNVLAGAIVLTVTIAGARLARDLVEASLNRMRVDYSHIVATVTFYVLMVFGIIMTLDQLGFDTTILSANVTIIVAGIVLALALAFGLGGRDTAAKMIDKSYKHFNK